jgi:PHP family Zn ribbon phosphoesterase
VSRIGGEAVSEALEKVRKGQVTIDPGYDGEYGKVVIPASEKRQIALDI